MANLDSEHCMVLTIEDAAKRLGLGRSAAYQAARSGDIPTIKIGRLIRVPKAALDRMLNAPHSHVAA